MTKYTISRNEINNEYEIRQSGDLIFSSWAYVDLEQTMIALGLGAALHDRKIIIENNIITVKA